MPDKSRTPVIVGAARTPIGKFLGALSPLSAPELGGIAIREALKRSAGTPDRFSASRMAMPPSSGALSGESAPRNLPIGVRAAPTMTGVRDLSGMIEVNPSPYHSEAT